MVRFDKDRGRLLFDTYHYDESLGKRVRKVEWIEVDVEGNILNWSEGIPLDEYGEPILYRRIDRMRSRR